MRIVSLSYNLLLAFVIFLGGQLLGAGQEATPNQSFSPEGPQLYLRAGAFDPLSQPAFLSRADSSTYQPDLYLVQYVGPIQDAWLASQKSCGLGAAGYVPDYAYVVWGTATAVDCLAQAAPLRWYGLYSSFYALHPSLMVPSESEKSEAPALVDVIVQIYEAPGTQATVQAILEYAVEIIRTPHSYLGYRALAVRLEQLRLAQIAALPGVVNVEPLPQYTRSDEVQGQIIAGNLNGDQSQPSGPGYLAWLTGLGFSIDPEDYPIVDVTDDGIDDGTLQPVHADFYQFGDITYPDRLVYNHDWTSDPSAAGTKGHGNLNASIVAGYNNLSGAMYKDGQGYHYGLGINPFGRVAGSKVFSSVWGWDLPNSDFLALINNTYLNGGRISTNSWGSASYGSYTWDDQTYDALVRDAVISQSGNQEIAIIFSSGNSGPWPGTTGSPGNAKNVLTVGAAESYRPTWTDGCGIGPLGADDANDIADFSSRGPTADGRMKPELVAPGTHIQGAASQAVGYSGEGICDAYHPGGQTLYAASSGTSHSAPAVAGAASLLYAYFQQHFNTDTPSPAMLKAYMTNSARYLDGYGAMDTLPSSSQGLGEIFLGRAFDGVPRTLVDQQINFSDSGQLYTIEASVHDSDQPLRISLAWSDAPGSPFSAAYVNNLDLEVEIGGQTYLGNVFSGALSITSGEADAKNNLESVFLPAGQSGPVVVRVRATNIAGDGVPNNADLTDQDFALVIYNAVQFMGSLHGTVTDQVTGSGLSGATVLALSDNWQYRTSTDPSGAYTITMPANVYSVSAWKFGYSLEAVHNVAILEDQVTLQDFSLSSVPTYQLNGCITDQATSQGLAASLSVVGPFGDLITQVFTTRVNPCYDLQLYAASFLLRAESLLHYPAKGQLDLDRDRVHDFSLEATTNNGLIHGRVTDFNTSGPLDDLELSFEPGFSPDPTIYKIVTGIDGDYEILLPPDTYTVSADAPFYTPLRVGEVPVPQSNLEERDFSMRSPLMNLSPAAEPLRFDLEPGDQISVTLQLNNTGSASLEYLVYESTGDSYSAGPDPAGYLLLDSRISNAARYEWIDSSDGTRLALGDDDEISINLPFMFTYYGRTSDVLRIGNNGAALFGVRDGHVQYNNQTLSLAPDYLIAPYWDDLDVDFGWVAYKTVGTQPTRRFVVEWYNRPHFNDANSGVTFELVMYEGSNNLKFQYKDVFFNNSSLDQGKSASVGIRGRGRSYLESSFNQPALVDNMALCFQAPGALPCDMMDIPWLVISPAAGSLSEQAEQPVTIQVYADLAGLGVHLASVRIRGNDPQRQPYIEIPIRLVVNGYELYFPYAGLTAFPGPP